MSEHPIRILFIITSLRKGGAERLILSIAQQLVVQNKAEVKIVIREKTVEYEIPSDIELICVSGKIEVSPVRKHIFETDEYKRLVNDFQPHIIHSSLHHAEFLAYSYILENIVYFSHIHSNVPEMKRTSVFDFFRSPKRMLTNLYEKEFLLAKYRKARTEFIACSKGIHSFIRQNISSMAKIHVLQNAIDLSSFNAAIRDKNFISGTLFLLNVATLSNVKNHFLLLKIADTLKKTKINFELNILGDGENFNALHQKILDYGLENHVFLRGSVHNVQQYYNKSHLYIHTSISEGLPMVFIEAMASSLPVITTNCISRNEIVRDGINGYILKQNDIAGFVQIIRMLVSQPELYKQLSDEAGHTSKDYDLQKYIDKLLLIYKRKSE